MQNNKDDEILRIRESFSKLQEKCQKQRNEVARLTQVVEALQRDKKALVADIKWMRGEHKSQKNEVLK